MILGYVYAILGVLIAAFSQILLKKGAMRPHISFIRDYLNPPVMSGYVLMAVSVFLPMLAYRQGLELMQATILEAINFVLVPVLSRLFFKEKLTARKVTGIIIIVLGVVVFYL